MNKPFKEDEPVKPPIFISREKELKELDNSIFTNQESVVINGYDTVGKSSLIFTFMNNLIDDDSKNKTFPIWINMKQFYDSLKGNFLSVITHQICARIWTDLLNNSYSELLEDTLLNTRKDKDISKFEKRLKRIFKIVTSEKLSGTGKSHREIGGNLFAAKGKVSETNEILNQRKPLQTFEFLLLIDELMEILHEHGLNRILVLCDELNHMPPKLNLDIFRSYLDVFSAKRIQFIIVAREERDEEMDNLISSFSSRFTLSAFQNVSDIKDLITNSLQVNKIENIIFAEESYEKIFQISEGYPWWTVKLCNYAFFEAVKSKQDIIDNRIIDKFSIPFLKAVSKYNEMMLTGTGRNRRDFEKMLSYFLEK